MFKKYKDILNIACQPWVKIFGRSWEWWIAIQGTSLIAISGVSAAGKYYHHLSGNFIALGAAISSVISVAEGLV